MTMQTKPPGLTAPLALTLCAALTACGGSSGGSSNPGVQIDADNAATVILGIGLNVNQSDFPSEFEHQATSLLLQTGQRIPRAALLADLLGRLEHYYDILTYDEAAVHRIYTSRLHGLGQSTTLRLTEQDETVTGVILGVSDTGALRLDTPDGPRTFHAGDVTGNPF